MHSGGSEEVVYNPETKAQLAFLNQEVLCVITNPEINFTNYRGEIQAPWEQCLWKMFILLNVYHLVTVLFMVPSFIYPFNMKME